MKNLAVAPFFLVALYGLMASTPLLGSAMGVQFVEIGGNTYQLKVIYLGDGYSCWSKEELELSLGQKGLADIEKRLAKHNKESDAVIADTAKRIKSRVMLKMKENKVFHYTKHRQTASRMLQSFKRSTHIVLL